MGSDKGNTGAGTGQAAQDPVMAMLTEIRGMVQGVQTDVKRLDKDMGTLDGNQQKLAARLEAVEAAGGGVSSGAVGEQLLAMQAQLEALQDRPEMNRSAAEAREKHSRALKRAGEKERELNVTMYWYPEPDDAKRGVPLNRVAHTTAEAEQLVALGYCGSLAEAAEVVADRPTGRGQKRLTVAEARAALHDAAGRIARGQVSGVQAVAPQPQRRAG